VAVSESPSTDRSLEQNFTWIDGFVITLAIPAAIYATAGPSIVALGALGAVLLWGISAGLAILHNATYAEMAAMFPGKSGGVALYANEGWRGRVPVIGPLAAFSYWFAWITSGPVFALLIGSLIQTTWFPHATWTFWDGAVHVGLPHLIAGALVIAVWTANYFGTRVTARVNYLVAGLMALPLAVFIIGSFATGEWSGSHLTFALNDPGQAWGGWKLALVWLFIMAWSCYGVEAAASFAPEYKDVVRDSSRALRLGALVVLLVYVLFPLGVSGLIGEGAIRADPITFYVQAYEQILGGATTKLMIAFVIAGMFLLMNVCSADGARALYGMSREGLTIRQVSPLNRWDVPGRALTIELLVNLGVVFFLGNVIAIILAGNMGYVLAHSLALSGFILLRRDRPTMVRPVRRAPGWVFLVAALAAADLLFLVVGVSNQQMTGYGGTKELLIGIGVLLLSIVLYAVRRLVQDRALREKKPRSGEMVY
jgi:amino acid transporter